MSVSINFGKETIEFQAGITIEEALISVDKKPDTYLFVINGVPVPMKTPLEEGKNVRALTVASGG